MRTKYRRAGRSSRAGFWLAVLAGASASVLAGSVTAQAATPGGNSYSPPNLTSLTFTPSGGIWTQTQAEHNNCYPVPDCSRGLLGRTDAHDGAPHYEEIIHAGVIVWAPGTNGYWVVTSTGVIYSRGSAPVLCEGNLSSCSGFSAGASSQITAAAADPQGRGLWAVGRDGKVWTASINANNPLPSYGDARDSGGKATGIAAAPDGSGYCISISDGGVYCRAQGDSSGGNLYHGSHPNADSAITGIAFYVDASQQVKGYWLVAQDGGVFSFDAPFWGSTGGNGPDVTNIVSFPLPGAKPGQDGASLQTQGYAWINEDGEVTVRQPGDE